jgi:5-methylcytosine-specific restriction endonuclease McrA
MIRAHPWCSVCGRRDDLTCDHIIPVSKGGTASRSNMRVVCRSCNSRRQNGNKLIEPPRPRTRFSRNELK